MTADDQHSALVDAWNVVHRILDEMPTSLRFGDSRHMEIIDKAQRVRSLGFHLDGAVTLMGAGCYEPAFALLRTCLEHVVVDWLVFQARTYVRQVSSVSEETWKQWQDARANGAEWTRTIRSWNRTKKGQVRIVYEGIYSQLDESGQRRQISIYYFLLEQYRPTIGPPSQQVEDGPIDRGALRQMAKENRAIWDVYLTWSSLITNLKENKLINEEDAGRLAVHYRFLSGYAHPVVDQRRQTYGNDATMGWPKFDHYSSELIMLYVITLGVLEARNFLASIWQHQDVAVADLDLLEQRLDLAEGGSSHFWFLGVNPHAYDMWKTRNETVWKALRSENKGIILGEPSPEDVAYPSDPLTRLVAMHSTASELTTGLTYISPWPRHDARFR